MDRINNYLQELGKKIRLPLALDAQGRCFLNYSKGLDCVMEVPEGSMRIFFYAPLLPLPSDYDSKLLLDILALNLHQVATQGATLAFDPSSQQFTLCFSQGIDSLDATSFENILGNFIETASSLKTQLLDLIA